MEYRGDFFGEAPRREPFGGSLPSFCPDGRHVMRFVLQRVAQSGREGNRIAGFNEPTSVP